MTQLNSYPAFPINEPTSAMNAGALWLAVATKLNTAYYGSTGSGPAQYPIDPHDFAEVNDIVTRGIRMFIADGPSPNGWKWAKPLAQVDFYPMIPADQTLGQTTWLTFGPSSYDPATNLTTLYLNYSSTVVPSTIGTSSTNAIPQFYPSMELRQIWIGGNPASNTPGWYTPLPGVPQPENPNVGVPFTVVQYIDPQTITVWGNATNIGNFTSTSTWSPSWQSVWSMNTVGDYTLPADFGGQYSGEITYVQNTNRGVFLRWTDEANIRARRSNFNFESGTPFEVCVRLIPTNTLVGLPNANPNYYPQPYAPQRRRWEICAWRIANQFLHAVFPYTLSFNSLVNPTDVPPSPLPFDEALVAACMAMAEKTNEDTIQGPDWQYYRTVALPQAYRIDAMSSPKNLGYDRNGLKFEGWRGLMDNFRQYNYQRPNVGTPTTWEPY